MTCVWFERSKVSILHWNLFSPHTESAQHCSVPEPTQNVREATTQPLTTSALTTFRTTTIMSSHTTLKNTDVQHETTPEYVRHDAVLWNYHSKPESILTLLFPLFFQWDWSHWVVQPQNMEHHTVDPLHGNVCLPYLFRNLHWNWVSKTLRDTLSLYTEHFFHFMTDLGASLVYFFNIMINNKSSMVKMKPNKHYQANNQELFRSDWWLLTDLIRFLLKYYSSFIYVLIERTNT